MEKEQGLREGVPTVTFDSPVKYPVDWRRSGITLLPVVFEPIAWGDN